MKPFSALAAMVLVCSFGTAQSQAPAAPSPQNTRRALETLKEANAKLIEQQAKTLQLLEEMEKTSQTLKSLGKRA
jgi:hypothetical protein